MATRLTANPYVLNVQITESGANTFTTVPIRIPFAPVIGRGKFIAIEIGRIISDASEGSIEINQNNRVRMQITRDLQTAFQNFASEQVIWERNTNFLQQQPAVEGLAIMVYDRIKNDDLTVDGKGVVYLEKEIHLAIQGIGNADATNGGVRIYIHLLSMTRDEVKQRLLERDVGGGSGEASG